MSYQKTIKNKISFKGVGIHTGEVTNVTCTPAPAGKGISFERVDLDSRPRWTLPAPLFVGDSEGAARRSRLGSQVGQIETVEHLMSAVWGLGISNLHVEVHGPEIPILDGSAEEFVRSFLKIGLVEQEVSRPSFAVSEPLFVHSGKSAILMLPHDTFRVTYTLDYDHPQLRGQTVALDLTEEAFIKEIAPARTFCTEQETDVLRKQGLGRGASYQNTLVMGDDGPLQNSLRFPDECARHKVLDLVGDLGWLGFDLQAHVVAVRSGHALNHQMRDLVLQQKESQYEFIR